MTLNDATVDSKNSQTNHLTGLSDNGTVRSMSQNPRGVKGRPRAILVQIPAWKCSLCGATVPDLGRNGAPRRCPNRKTCGAYFYKK